MLEGDEPSSCSLFGFLLVPSGWLSCSLILQHIAFSQIIRLIGDATDVLPALPDAHFDCVAPSRTWSYDRGHRVCHAYGHGQRP